MTARCRSLWGIDRRRRCRSHSRAQAPKTKFQRGNRRFTADQTYLFSVFEKRSIVFSLRVVRHYPSSYVGSIADLYRVGARSTTTRQPATTEPSSTWALGAVSMGRFRPCMRGGCDSRAAPGVACRWRGLSRKASAAPIFRNWWCCLGLETLQKVVLEILEGAASPPLVGIHLVEFARLMGVPTSAFGRGWLGALLGCRLLLLEGSTLNLGRWWDRGHYLGTAD